MNDKPKAIIVILVLLMGLIAYIINNEITPTSFSEIVFFISSIIMPFVWALILVLAGKIFNWIANKRINLRKWYFYTALVSAGVGGFANALYEYTNDLKFLFLGIVFPIAVVYAMEIYNKKSTGADIKNNK